MPLTCLLYALTPVCVVPDQRSVTSAEAKPSWAKSTVMVRCVLVQSNASTAMSPLASLPACRSKSNDRRSTSFTGSPSASWFTAISPLLSKIAFAEAENLGQISRDHKGALEHGPEGEVGRLLVARHSVLPTSSRSASAKWPGPEVPLIAMGTAG